MPKGAVGSTVLADRPEFRVLQRVLVHAVVAEGREAEQDLDALRVGMVDQVAHEVVADVLVLGVVPPGDRVLLGAERPGDPEQQRVAAVVVDAVDDPPPVVQVVGRHPHERDVVAPPGERAVTRPLVVVGSGHGQERCGDEHGEHRHHALDADRSSRPIRRIRRSRPTLATPPGLSYHAGAGVDRANPIVGDSLRARSSPGTGLTRDHDERSSEQPSSRRSSCCCSPRTSPWHNRRRSRPSSSTSGPPPSRGR